MANVKFELNYSGVSELLKGAEMQNICSQLADKVLNQCDGVLFPGGIKFTPFDRYVLEKITSKFFLKKYRHSPSYTL